MTRAPFMWTPGVRVAYYPGEPGHDVIDTGMQLITRCGRQVTYLGARVDSGTWVPVVRLGCFECRPSPLIEWTTDA